VPKGLVGAILQRCATLSSHIPTYRYRYRYLMANYEGRDVYLLKGFQNMITPKGKGSYGSSLSSPCSLVNAGKPWARMANQQVVYEAF
jgi:hypothetical protein